MIERHALGSAGRKRTGQRPMAAVRRRRALRLQVEPLEQRLAPAVSIAEYPISNPQSEPMAITLGPDGALWFGGIDSQVGRVDPSTGAITMYAPPNLTFTAGITSGPNDTVWLTNAAVNQIVRVNAATGAMTTYSVTNALSEPGGIVYGPEDAIWFAESGENNEIVRVDPQSGAMTDYPLPALNEDPIGTMQLTVAPNGDLWFTGPGANEIGRFDPTTGAMNVFPVPAQSGYVAGITSDASGDIWFTSDRANAIEQFDPSTGGFTTFVIAPPTTAPIGIIPAGIVAAPNGAIWFCSALTGQVGMLDPSTGAIDAYPVGYSWPEAIALDASGHVWFTTGTAGNRVGELTPTPSPAATSITLTSSAVPAVAGQALTLTAVVTGSDGGDPGGDVVFNVDGQAQPAVPLQMTGGEDVATLSLSTLAPGSHTISATYEGDVNYAPSSSDTVAQPVVAPPAFVPNATAYLPPRGFTGLGPLTLGPDGAIWFTEKYGNAIGRIDPATGAISEFPLSNSAGLFGGITSGPDGDLWFTEFNGDIGALNPSTGAIALYPTPGINPLTITVGSDGALWFTESGYTKIGRLDPATGAVTQVTVPGLGGNATTITAGPDGNIWFIDPDVAEIGVLNIATGAISAVAPIARGALSETIATGSDGNLWFSDSAGTITRFDPKTGVTTQFPLPSSQTQPLMVVAGPNGDIWYTEPNTDQVGRIDPATGVVTEFPVMPGLPGSPADSQLAAAITFGPGGVPWISGGGPPNEDQLIALSLSDTVTQLSASASPSLFGQPVSLTAVVTAVGTSTPGGTVVFTIDGQQQAPVPLVEVQGQDEATLTFSNLSLGNHVITASYQGDANDLPSTAASIDLATLTSPEAGAPALSPYSTYTAGGATGVTHDPGGPNWDPIVFAIPQPDPNLFYTLYDVTNPAAPVQIAPPEQLFNGYLAARLIATLSNGVYDIAYTTSLTADGVQGPLSQAQTITVDDTVRIIGISPSSNSVAALPNGQIVVTFDQYLGEFSANVADGGEFEFYPFTVMLVPSGPEDGALAAQGLPPWSAPTGVDGGDLPVPATLMYHENADGTSTITLTPNEPLAPNVYLIEVSASFDNGHLVDANGTPGPAYFSFDLRASTADNSPLSVTSVSTRDGTVPIDNNLIPQPDTIGIAFNKPLDAWTVNSSTVQLLARNAQGGTVAVPSAVTFSPSTDTVYLTPEAVLSPGTIYYVDVHSSVSDDQNFPAPGGTLGQPFYTSFTVAPNSVPSGSVPSTSPANGTVQQGPLGYVSIRLGAPVNMAALGRYSVMLVPRTGGATTGTSGYADVSLNAKLAFNPNTEQIIIVPTVPLAGNAVYLVALSGVKGTNGASLLTGTFYTTFLLEATGAERSLAATHQAASAGAPSSGTSAAGVEAVVPEQRPAKATAVVVAVRTREADRTPVPAGGRPRFRVADDLREAKPRQTLRRPIG